MISLLGGVLLINPTVFHKKKMHIANNVDYSYPRFVSTLSVRENTIDQSKKKIIFYEHGGYKSEIRHSMSDFILMLLSWPLGAVLSL